jgi:hypothetical protein
VADSYLFRVHAVQRMARRSISADAVIAVVEQDDRIEDYRDDTPYPSRLLIGVVAGRTLHMVAADAPAGVTIIITVYEPNPERWDSTLRTRADRWDVRFVSKETLCQEQPPSRWSEGPRHSWSETRRPMSARCAESSTSVK